MNFTGLSQVYRELLEKFPCIVSLEDPFHFEDWGAFAALTEELGLNTQILGDLHSASNSTLVLDCVEAKSINGVTIRLNEAGTVSEMIEIVQTARSEGWGVVTSMSKLEVDDSFLSDFSVGVKAGLIKVGSMKGGIERICKLNQLLRIEKNLGDSSYFAGDRWRNTG